MSFSITNRALLRGMLAGAVVLTGTACSRSDRAKSGPDNTAAAAPDTRSNAAQSANSGTVTGAVSDTATPSEKDAAAAPVTSDSATTEMSASSSASADVADTAAAGYTEMARDTSTVADQADTAAANGDVALTATVDTSSEANADVSAETGVTADSTDNAGRIRPPEDSTEILGNVTTNEGDETADEQVVRPEDRETVAASETPKDDVGAAAIGGDVTGAEAVALMTREGLRCAVVDPEANQAVRWDMSSTPVSLNPCGMGSMVPSRIWTVGSGQQK